MYTLNIIFYRLLINGILYDKKKINDLCQCYLNRFLCERKYLKLRPLNTSQTNLSAPLIQNTVAMDTRHWSIRFDRVRDILQVEKSELTTCVLRLFLSFI